MEKAKSRAHSLLRGQSINTLLLLSFVIEALLPVSILGINSYYAAWENAWREVREKHQTLAENLSAPIAQYVNNRRIALSLLREKMVALENTADPKQNAAVQLNLGPEELIDKLFDSGRTFLSPVVINPFTGKTTLMVGTLLHGASAMQTPLLLVGELKIGAIEALRQGIQFGEQGHAAIVDQLGRVIAHPNPAWTND